MLNISKKIHVAWDSGQMKYELPEAIVAPVGDSKKERKKIESLAHANNMFVDYDNVPLPGFTLFDANKRKYSDYDSSWIVIDPRGFMARISNSNMSKILKVTGITEGLVQQKCVWARQDEDTELTLVPVSSEQYNIAVKNTTLINDKVDISDVQIGDIVLLQNELEGIYLGTMSLYGSVAEFPSGIKVVTKLRKQIIEVTSHNTAPNSFHYNTDVKILKVLKKSDNPMTREEAVEYVNNKINTQSSFFTTRSDMKNYYYSVDERIKFVSINAQPKVKLTLEPITLKEATDLYNTCYTTKDNGCLVVEDSAGKKFITHYPWLTTVYPDQTKFNTSEIIAVEDDKLKSTRYNTAYYSMSTPPTYTLGKFKKFYKIIKTVKNESYI